MSAPNQVLSNESAFYLDQYTDTYILMVADSAGPDNYVLNIRYHRQGHLVMFSIIGSPNSGLGIGATSYSCLNAIPNAFRPGYDNYILASATQTLGVITTRTVVTLKFSQNGTITAYPTAPSSAQQTPSPPQDVINYATFVENVTYIDRATGFYLTNP